MSEDMNRVNEEIINKTIENEKANENVENDVPEDLEKETTEIKEEKSPKKKEIVDNKDKKTDDVDEKVPERSLDSVQEAKKALEEAKKELEEFESFDNNVFEELEKAKKELEEKRQLHKVTLELEETKAKLESHKRKSIIDNLLKTGQINDNLRGWAENLSFEQLQEFSKHAPKVKTILDQKNSSEIGIPNEDMQKWKEQQMKSRIIG